MRDLRQIRRFLELTQQEVELATGITARRISLAENGFLTLSYLEEEAVREYLGERMCMHAEIRERVLSLSAPEPQVEWNDRKAVVGLELWDSAVR
jgi:hypothetical protein